MPWPANVAARGRPQTATQLPDDRAEDAPTVQGESRNKVEESEQDIRQPQIAQDEEPAHVNGDLDVGDFAEAERTRHHKPPLIPFSMAARSRSVAL